MRNKLIKIIILSNSSHKILVSPLKIYYTFIQKTHKWRERKYNSTRIRQILNCEERLSVIDGCILDYYQNFTR